MDSLKRVWKWTKSNLEWVCIGANAVIVAAVIYYTVQSTSITLKYEQQNLQLIKDNTTLLEQNRNLSQILNQATDVYHRQNEAIQKQKVLIDMQHEGIQKLLLRIKQLERLLNDDFIAAS